MTIAWVVTAFLVGYFLGRLRREGLVDTLARWTSFVPGSRANTIKEFERAARMDERAAIARSMESDLDGRDVVIQEVAREWGDAIRAGRIGNSDQ